MSRTYGSRYDQTAGMTPVQVAKLIRADLKAAAKGTGPLAGLSFSVRVRNYNGVDIAVDGLADSDIYTPGDRSAYEPAVRGCEIRTAVRAIADAYNWYNAEYPDRRFYVNVNLIDERHRQYKATLKAEKSGVPA